MVSVSWNKREQKVQLLLKCFILPQSQLQQIPLTSPVSYDTTLWQRVTNMGLINLSCAIQWRPNTDIFCIKFCFYAGQLKVEGPKSSCRRHRRRCCCSCCFLLLSSWTDSPTPPQSLLQHGWSCGVNPEKRPQLQMTRSRLRWNHFGKDSILVEASLTFRVSSLNAGFCSLRDLVKQVLWR